MAGEKSRRIDLKAYKRQAKANMRKWQAIRIESLKAEFRELAWRCKIDSDSLPASAEDLLRQLALPDDFSKIVSFLGICSPKTLRIAAMALRLWNVMDSRVYMRTIKETFFDASGGLKPERLDVLFRRFHSKLQNEACRIKKENEQWVPFEKVKKYLD